MKRKQVLALVLSVTMSFTSISPVALAQEAAQSTEAQDTEVQPESEASVEAEAESAHDVASPEPAETASLETEQPEQAVSREEVQQDTTAAVDTEDWEGVSDADLGTSGKSEKGQAARQEGKASWKPDNKKEAINSKPEDFLEEAEAEYIEAALFLAEENTAAVDNSTTLADGTYEPEKFEFSLEVF